MAEIDLNIRPLDETQESAQEFIKRLGENGLENINEEMKEMIKAELEANYDELYGRPGHFLHELLQNADDVEYEDPDPEPTFSIATHDPFDFVRFDCNETGFTRKNVRSICRSRMSTKVGDTGTVGEKGIGFKSVFAVAATASIASGPYRFKLNKSEEFGVICPTVWDVPSEIAVKKTGSTLVLEIDKTEKVREEVRNIIRNFDPDTMLFLRKLKRVEINTYQYLDPDIFRREELSSADGTTHVMIQKNGRYRSCFKVFESLVTNFTPRRKYPDVKESRIKLAFPVDANFENAIASSSTQQVYTFLPISEYGLEFTIQAEFVLTSNREDIQPRVEWNDELLEAIPRIFCDAIKVLNQTSLRFSWPIFLSLTEPKGFFKNVRRKIIAKLAEEAVLQVEDGTKPLAVPSTVMIVPDEFKFQGVPLIRSKAALSRYLSHKYSTNSIPYLKYAMSIKELDTDRFLEDLKEYVDDESSPSSTLGGDDTYVPYKAQSTEWHSRVASILEKNTRQPLVKAMKIIPLSDGETWVAATPENKGSIFFQSQKDWKHDILDGVDIKFVHPDIMSEKEEQRFLLFNALGVESFDASKLGKLVEAAHIKSSDTLASNLGDRSLTKTLISHALFLFRNNHSPSVDLWVATEAGKASRASTTYFQDIGREIQGYECPVLHKDYYACIDDEQEMGLWRQWLDMELGIRKYPRLVDTFPRLESSILTRFNIAEEMECILNDASNWKPYDILKLLQKHWDTGHWANYSQWLRESNDVRWSSGSVYKAKERISELQVNCLGPHGRVSHSLKGAILPSFSLEGTYEGAPVFILDVWGDGVQYAERVEGRNWSFLQHVGVKLYLDLDDCIACLRTLRDDVDPGKREAFVRIPFLYDRINRICQDTPEWHDRVKGHFNSEELIYIPQYSKNYTKAWPINATWVTAQNCVWKGAKYAKLKNHSAISHHYGRHEKLFLEVVRVQFTIEISDILSEIELNAASYGPNDLYGILQELSEFIKENSDARGQRSRRSGSGFRSVLSRHPIFPISQPGSTSITNHTCAPTSQWFIPDHQSFHSLFSEKIPLMVFDSMALSNISHLLQYLDCNWRRLSSQARAYPENPEKVRYARNYSARLQGKAKYIQSLVPDSLPYRRPSLVAVEIAVHRVDSDTVTVQWEVEWDSSTYKSSVYESQVVVMLHGKTLTIYMPAKYIHQQARPPLDLAPDLVAFLGIPPERSALVEQILTRVWDSDTTEIETALTRKGFRFDFFREDEVREEKSSERPPVIETEENSQAPSDELVVVKSEPHLIEEETGVPITETKLYMTDQQVTSIDLVKDVKSEKDGKDLINNIATPSDFSVTSSLTELPARTTAYEIPLTDPENMLEDFQLVLDEDNKDFQKLPEMVDKVLGDGESNLLQVSSSIRVKGESSRVQQGAEEVHYRIEASTPLISEEKLYYRPHLSSPTPSDNDDPDDSDYSTDDSDPPLPGAQLGSKRNEAKMSDKNQNRSKDELLTSSSNKEDQSRIQATPKPTTTSSKHSHIPPPKDISLRQLQQFISPLRNTTQNKRVDEQYNVTRRLQKTGLFRLSGPTSIIYVSNPDDLPPMESKNNDTQVLATLQARMQIFKDDNRSVFALIPTIANDEDTELAFLGQAWVSQMLFNYLGSVYKPQRDWRSPMRAGLGYDELEAPISNSETPFIIEKDTGALSQFLFQQGYEPAGRWMRSLPGVRTYYIDVQTTPESRTRPFTITPSRMEKMRECRISRNSEVPEKVYILIRLSSVYSRHPGVVPTASFYVDPWDFYTEGYMHVKLNNELFSMRISIEARPHFTMKSPEREVHDSDDSTSSSDIIDRVVRLFSSNRSQEPTRPPNVSQSQRSYKYMSLRRADKIRLLALRPGKGAAPLWGELEVHRLPENSSPPDYVCISYVWGSSLKQFSLYTPEGILMLTASLYLALLHLRDVNKTIYLWADAICIDQEDSPGQRNEEKEHQILMLPRIFRYAKTVFAWLGIEENGSRKVMRKFEDWGTKITQGKHEELKDKIEVTDPIWVSISRLLNRRWFTRMWIVQEVVLARKLIIVCGKHRLSWDIFYAAAKHCLIRNKYDPKIDIATLDTAKNIIDLGKLRNSFQKREDFRSKQTVFTLLNQCYQKDATVPRDRIFALLSMATDKDEVGFRPNYQASNLEIIQQFASTFVKQGYALELLYRTRPETRLIEEQGMRSKTEVMLPSWVPNLTANQYPSSLSTWSRNHLAGIRKDEGSNHGGKAELKNLAKVDGKALILRGYVACKVNNKGKNHSMLDDVMAYLGEIFSTIDKLYDGKKTAREIEEIKWKTAIGDATSLANEVDDNKRGDDDGNEASTRIPHTPEKVKKIQQHKQHKQERFEAQAISAYGALVGYLASERPHSNWKKQKSRFEYAMKGQKVFDANRDAWQRLLPYVYKAIAFAEVFAPQRVVVCDTDKRDVGIVPAVAEKGDVVALFPGAKVPFILREKSAGEYELIGECYIHGIMRGEGLPATNEDEKVFRLV